MLAAGLSIAAAGQPITSAGQPITTPFRPTILILTATRPAVKEKELLALRFVCSRSGEARRLRADGPPDSRSVRRRIKRPASRRNPGVRRQSRGTPVPYGSDQGSAGARLTEEARASL